ncbi:hypothetical protein [Streptococcus sanguinis]|uniref:hypothetical protein n=1 Tax=Streptococcus sanguinis TaxID=1305 RepID=UPI00228396DB|nr:hypothetical protein [Streptococcus sanguinis]MCY7024072.1 hypothetical protein [Streptococcus sanguinis]
MDNEQLKLSKETLDSISSARDEFAKLYASMNAEQIGNLIKPIREFTKKVYASSNANLTAAASSMDKELIDVNKVISASYSFNSLNTISTMMKEFLNSYQTTIFRDLSAISEALKSLPNYYSEEEIADIKSRLEILATKGWVVYFQDTNFSYYVDAEDFEEVEEFWFEMLEKDIADEKTVTKLEASRFIPEVLIQSMIKSYKSENYYAAYTMATIIIDGVMNRISEKNYNKNHSKAKNIPVGKTAVSILNAEFTNKKLLDTGLPKWLYLFFENTNKFTLDWPNRHMINHGRWAEELSKKDFLKIFNTVMYIDEVVNTRISYV